MKNNNNNHLYYQPINHNSNIIYGSILSNILFLFFIACTIYILSLFHIHFEILSTILMTLLFLLVFLLLVLFNIFLVRKLNFLYLFA